MGASKGVEQTSALALCMSMAELRDWGSIYWHGLTASHRQGDKASTAIFGIGKPNSNVS
jgi:hypothetical protein